MADKTPWLAAERGIYSSSSQLVGLLDDAIDLGGYPSRTFDQAATDTDTDFALGDTIQITISAGPDDWMLYAGAEFVVGTGTPWVINLDAATLLASEGTLANGMNVYVFAGQPPGALGDMLASVYDPQGIASDAFARENHTGTQLLATISDSGTAAASDAGDFDAAGTAAAGDTAHLSAFDHGNIPSTDQAAALDNNNTLDAGNPAASMADITLVGDERYPQSTDNSVSDIQTMTQAEYDALAPPDTSTLYLICEGVP